METPQARQRICPAKTGKRILNQENAVADIYRNATVSGGVHGFRDVLR